MNTIADVRRANLRFLIERDGLSSVARRAGKPDRQLNDMVAGRKSFGEKVARDIELSLDPSLKPGWLDAPLIYDANAGSGATLLAVSDCLLPSPTGATSEHPARPDPTSETLPIPSDDDYALIPQYSARAACGPAYHNGHVEVRGGLAFKRDWLARMGLRPESLSVIAANGESMAPTIHDGEVLLIDHSDTEPQDGKVFALARGDEMVVKRLARDFAGGWVVRSDNSDKARFGDFHVSDSAIRIVGRVVWRGGGL